jgi:hypothetical protein
VPYVCLSCHCIIAFFSYIAQRGFLGHKPSYLKDSWVTCMLVTRMSLVISFVASIIIKPFVFMGVGVA